MHNSGWKFGQVPCLRPDAPNLHIPSLNIGQIFCLPPCLGGGSTVAESGAGTETESVAGTGVFKAAVSSGTTMVAVAGVFSVLPNTGLSRTAVIRSEIVDGTVIGTVSDGIGEGTSDGIGEGTAVVEIAAGIGGGASATGSSVSAAISVSTISSAFSDTTGFTEFTEREIVEPTATAEASKVSRG